MEIPKVIIDRIHEAQLAQNAERKGSKELPRFEIMKFRGRNLSIVITKAQGVNNDQQLQLTLRAAGEDYGCRIYGSSQLLYRAIGKFISRSEVREVKDLEGAVIQLHWSDQPLPDITVTKDRPKEDIRVAPLKSGIRTNAT